MLLPPQNNFKKIPVYCYEWKSWPNFLFPSLYNNAVRIEAEIHQSNASILENIITDEGYFLFHLNLTKTAFFYADKQALLNLLEGKGIIPLNAGISDTSKKFLQSACKKIGLNFTQATFDGDPEELLIVKTNFNHGGKPEKRLKFSEFRLLNLSSADYKGDNLYPVLKRNKVKKRAWKNENLIIEKYINNRDDIFYRVYKLLNKIVISEVTDKNLIKKMRPDIKRNNTYFDLNDKDPVPADHLQYIRLVSDIEHLCGTLKIDFAAIDVVRSDDDKYYIIDVNATPNWNREDYTEILHFLSEGIV